MASPEGRTHASWEVAVLTQLIHQPTVPPPGRCFQSALENQLSDELTYFDKLSLACARTMVDR